MSRPLTYDLDISHFRVPQDNYEMLFELPEDFEFADVEDEADELDFDRDDIEFDEFEGWLEITAEDLDY